MDAKHTLIGAECDQIRKLTEKHAADMNQRIARIRHLCEEDEQNRPTQMLRIPSVDVEPDAPRIRRKPRVHERTQLAPMPDALPLIDEDSKTRPVAGAQAPPPGWAWQRLEGDHRALACDTVAVTLAFPDGQPTLIVWPFSRSGPLEIPTAVVRLLGSVAAAERPA